MPGITTTTVPFGPPPADAEGHRVAMRDGVRLATDVYLPPAPGRLTAPGRRTAPGPDSGRLPVVLIRTPYDKTRPETLIPDIAARLTAAGFAVVAQDVRGKIRSEGDPVPFVAEVPDGADTCEWITRQPWSDGTVACWGNSYYGFTAWAAAASGHPAVRRLVTRVVATDVGGELLNRNGVFRLGPVTEWLRSTWSGPANVTEEIDFAHRSPRDLLSGLPEAVRKIAALPPGSPRWAALCFAGRSPGHGRLPALHGAGWFDFTQAGQLADWRRARRTGRNTGAPQYLVAAAADHMDGLFLPDAGSPDHLTDPAAREAMLDRSLSPVIDFLRGGTPPPVRWQLAGADTDHDPGTYSTGTQPGWHHEHTWPPPWAREIRLHLDGADRACQDGGEGGSLSLVPARRPGTATWEHDPADPVPCLDRDWWRPLLDVPDERAVERRPDVAVFTSDAWRGGLRLAGPVRLSVPAADGPLIVKLCDVAPDGRSRRILEAPSPPGGPVALHLGDTGYRLRPGHRLRLQIASACFPYYSLAPRGRCRLPADGACLRLTVLPG